MILDTITAPTEDIEKIKQKYKALETNKELEKRLSRLMKKQKRALNTNGPHPHHPQQQLSSQIPS